MGGAGGRARPGDPAAGGGAGRPGARGGAGGAGALEGGGGSEEDDFLDFLDAEALAELERAEVLARAARAARAGGSPSGRYLPAPQEYWAQHGREPLPPGGAQQQTPNLTPSREVSGTVLGMTLAERRRLSAGRSRRGAPPPAVMERETGMLHPGPVERVPQRTLESLWGGGDQGPSGIMRGSGGGGGWSGSGLAAQPTRRGGGTVGSGWPGPEDGDFPDTGGDAGSAQGAVSICEEAAAHWIYPSHPPRRDYQFSICQSALLRNTLVCLPTGLGKTLIAAVVMYNFYRWFPDGKIVFVAPTKPLVHQQVQACHRIMGIPSAHTAEMTGATKAEDRALWYKHCRVFFATPQTIQNDVRRGLLPAAKVVCLVVDECHRAVGRYASAGIARDLRSYGGTRARFRVLGLSATPGSTHEAVQQVVANLDIARVEFRGDTDPDVAPYTHPRLLEKVVVKPSGSLAECREKLLRAMEAAVSGLAARGFAFNANAVENINRFVFIQAQRALRANPGLANRGAAAATVDSDAGGGGARGAVAATHLLLEQAILLASLREQFDLHGAEVAWNYLLGQQQSPRNGLRRLLEESQPFKSFHARLEFLVSQGAYNPKVEELKNILRENLVSEKVGGGPSSSTALGGVGGREKGAGGAAIVFTTLRNSVDCILKALTGEPGLRAQAFVGQGSSRGDHSEGPGGVVKARKGMSQKEQKQVLKDFREGRFNVLVATCVAEEGLDIPEVSLIVCFDTSASPGRNTQRIGRTGRHGQGKVVYLLSAGKEVKDYSRNQALTRRLHNHLRSGGQNFELSRRSPRMVPHRFSPACRVEDIQVSQGAHGNPLLRSLQNSLWKNADALKDISNAFKGFGGSEGPTSKPSRGSGGGVRPLWRGAPRRRKVAPSDLCPTLHRGANQHENAGRKGLSSKRGIRALTRPRSTRAIMKVTGRRAMSPYRGAHRPLR